MLLPLFINLIYPNYSSPSPHIYLISTSPLPHLTSRPPHLTSHHVHLNSHLPHLTSAHLSSPPSVSYSDTLSPSPSFGVIGEYYVQCHPYFTYRLDGVKSRFIETAEEFEVARRRVKKAKQTFEKIKYERYELFMKCFEHVSSRIDDIYKVLMMPSHTHIDSNTAPPT